LSIIFKVLDIEQYESETVLFAIDLRSKLLETFCIHILICFNKRYQMFGWRNNCCNWVFV